MPTGAISRRISARVSILRPLIPGYRDFPDGWRVAFHGLFRSANGLRPGAGNAFSRSAWQISGSRLPLAIGQRPRKSGRFI